MIKAAKDDTVTIRYKGTLTDGTLFDQSPDERPLKFIIGKNEIISGVEAAVEGMYKGETRTVTIPCASAYGEKKPELIEQVKRSQMPADLDLRQGGRLEITREDGSVLTVMVVELDEDHVTLDANHPLAGQDLVFEIELLEVSKKPAR